MSVTYGFYNSSNGDRKYNATHLNTLFNGLISDGIFSTTLNQFAVSPTEVIGKSCRVDTGKAWLLNTWTINDSVLVFSDEIETVTNIAGRSRIDMICITIDAENRVNKIEYINGTEGTSPVRPIPAENQFPIAYIQLYGDDNSYIRAENITLVVGQTRTNGGTPLVTGMLQQMSMDELLAQWDAAFSIWFDEIKGQLSTDVAGQLQNEIDDMIQYGTAPLTSSSLIENGKVYFQYEE